ncbi:hypothetical protein TNCV_2925991 [Trichonephila clavipes]|nr:hypothetical protein TNCV_2925991 [Trichonephila clavipes]
MTSLTLINGGSGSQMVMVESCVRIVVLTMACHEEDSDVVLLTKPWFKIAEPIALVLLQVNKEECQLAKESLAQQPFRQSRKRYEALGPVHSCFMSSLSSRSRGGHRHEVVAGVS